jgi:Leucine rich repeat
MKALLWLLQEDEAHLCPSDAPSVFTQRYVLALLYFATNGNEWSNCTRAEVSTFTPCLGGASRFLSPQSECTWGGCKCDSAGNILSINIDNNNLRGSIPKEIGALDSINELDFEHNFLTGTIPESIGKLSQLLYLDLDENHLTGTIPEGIYSLSLLRALDLDTNILTGTISTKIGQLENLYIAQYDNNHMVGTIPSEAGLLDQLGYLTIVGNNFTGSVPNSLCNSVAKVYANCEHCMGEGCCEECA